MKKSTTYKLIFKARHTGAFVQADFDVRFGNHTGGELVASNPSSGTANLNKFQPLLTTSNTWHSVELKTPDYEIIAPSIQVVLAGSFDVFIDEFYLFESVNVAAMCAFDHGGYFQLDKISGRNAASIRTGQTNGIDFFDFIPSSIKFLSGNAGIKEIAVGVFPVYSISVQNVTGISELLLCEKWALPFNPILPFRPNQKKKRQNIFTSRSGVETRTTLFEEKKREGILEALSDADLSRYLNDWVPYHFDDDDPFVVRWLAGEAPMLMINSDPESGEIFKALLPDWSFKFKEVIG